MAQGPTSWVFGQQERRYPAGNYQFATVQVRSMSARSGPRRAGAVRRLFRQEGEG